jgi:hypothetical protein
MLLSFEFKKFVTDSLVLISIKFDGPKCLAKALTPLGYCFDDFQKRHLTSYIHRIHLKAEN